MHLYIASFFDTRARLKPVVATLTSLGYTLMSRWLDEASGATYTTSTPEYLADCAWRDLLDIGVSDIVVIDTIDATPRAGREVELGWALGLGKTCYVVGPKRNVFHEIIRNFATWEDALEYFAWAKS